MVRKIFNSKSKVESLDVVFELLDKAYRTFQALNQERVMSPGGIVTATKTYIRSAIVVLDFTFEWHKDDVEHIEKLLKSIEGFYEAVKRKEDKLSESDEREAIVLAKKLKKVREELRRVEVRLREIYVKLKEG